MTLSGRISGESSQGVGNGFPHAPTLQRNAEKPNTDHSDLKQFVYGSLLNSLSYRLYESDLDSISLQRHVLSALSEGMKISQRALSGSERARLMQEIVDEILGLGPLQPLLRDDDITEIMVNTYKKIYVERHGSLELTKLHFGSEEHLRRTIDRIVAKVGRRIDESSPLVDARLPDGSRVNAAIPPVSLDGCSLTIRKFSSEPFSSRDMVAMGTLTEPSMEFLKAAVRGKLNILVSGGTGSGKTTTLNVLSSFIPTTERIVTIEDAAELRLSQPHVVRLESRPPNSEGHGLVTIRDLVRNALRMRPDRIIVGEVRDEAAFDMLQAMNTGHEGSLTTIHANSPREALMRLEALVLMSGLDLPLRVVREQIRSAVDLVVQQSRLRDGTRRVMTISEVLGLDETGLIVRDIYDFDFNDNSSIGTLMASGHRPAVISRLEERGVKIQETVFDRHED